MKQILKLIAMGAGVRLLYTALRPVAPAGQSRAEHTEAATEVSVPSEEFPPTDREQINAIFKQRLILPRAADAEALEIVVTAASGLLRGDAAVNFCTEGYSIVGLVRAGYSLRRLGYQVELGKTRITVTPFPEENATQGETS